VWGAAYLSRWWGKSYLEHCVVLYMYYRYTICHCAVLFTTASDVVLHHYHQWVYTADFFFENMNVCFYREGGGGHVTDR
jgi:hypothetical protein